MNNCSKTINSFKEGGKALGIMSSHNKKYVIEVLRKIGKILLALLANECFYHFEGQHYEIHLIEGC